MSSTPASAGKQLCDLPNDIYRMIADLLPNKDLKSARLVDRLFRANAFLRFPRVYISPNQTNIDVFTWVARSSSSSSVKEIVWDDALFPDIEKTELYIPDESYLDDDSWSVFDVPLPMIEDPARMTDPNCRLYARLYKEQQAIIASGADAQAFRDALPLLTSLERVTVTPTTYQPMRHLQPGHSSPRHYTPMLKALPRKSKIPAPFGWNHPRDDCRNSYPEWEYIKGSWHGLCVVLQELARCDRAVPELVCDVNREHAGIPWQLFEDRRSERSEELHNLETICSRGLRRLDLAIRVSDKPWWKTVDFAHLTSGRLGGILQKATAMESFSLHTNADMCREGTIDESGEPLSHGIRILDVVPLQSWPKLRHLTLSNLHIDPHDFLEALKQVPPTLECLELVALKAVPHQTWRSTFERIRDTLYWTGDKPKISFAKQSDFSRSKKYWVDYSVIPGFLRGHIIDPFNAAGQFAHMVCTVEDDYPEMAATEHWYSKRTLVLDE